MKNTVRLLLLFVAALTVTLVAQTPGDQIQIRVTYDQEALAVDDDPAVGFDTAIISPTCTDCPLNVLRATLASCVNIGDTVWVRSDGEDAVSGEGIPILGNVSFSIFGYGDISNFSAISGAGDSSTIHCLFSRIP